MGECLEVLGVEPVFVVVGVFGMGCVVVLMVGLEVVKLVEEEGEEAVVVLVVAEQGVEVALSPSTLRTRLSVTLLSQTWLATFSAGAVKEDEREQTAALPQLGTFA